MDRASFVDECTVHVRGGDGGNGSVSFRREAHVPRGGPDGGDGGRGGHVIFVADGNVNSLIDLHRSPHIRGDSGRHGAGMARYGSDGADRRVAVPIGTLIKDRDTGAVLADLIRDGQSFVAVEGGRGGRGNLSFANRHRRVPTFAERGETAQERSLRLELKLIADVGLVGMPSAGKSSLIRRLSAARPRVAEWPFTTLTPHLGVMRAGDGPDGQAIDVVLADVPGLVEGAAEGRGLGLQFLRHIERCLVLVHVLDGFPMATDRDPVSDLAIIEAELARYDPSLLQRPAVLVITKMDLPDAQVMAELVAERLAHDSRAVFAVSTMTGEGLDALRFHLGGLVAEQRRRQAAIGAHMATGDDGDAEVVVDVSGEPAMGAAAETVIRLRPKASEDFTVERDADDRFVVRGRRIERWVQMLPLEDAQAVRYLQGRMRRAGVEKALVAAGARHGDDVVIGDDVFTFDPDLEDLPAEERAAILAAEAADDAAEMAHDGAGQAGFVSDADDATGDAGADSDAVDSDDNGAARS